ncbi:MAG: aldehyde dehydrogenase family protein [Thermoanaerobaculia bacterium]
MAAWKVAPALTARATPSSSRPSSPFSRRSSSARSPRRSGLPPGVLNVLPGTGPDAGEPLTRHPEVDKLAFTGSVPTGTLVMSAAASRSRTSPWSSAAASHRSSCFADSDLDAAVEWVMFGIFWNQGQVCSATSRLIVESSLAPRLVERLMKRRAGSRSATDGRRGHSSVRWFRQDSSRRCPDS